MKRIDQYIFKQILGVTLLIAMILTGIMVMTQSLRFLDLIMTSGASGFMFLTLTLMAIPRFFEVIVPIALAISATHVFVRLRQDGEMTILHASGLAPARIARAGALCAIGFAVGLFFVLAYVAPLTLSRMYVLRENLRMQFSAALLQPGVFHTLADGQVTVYIERRLPGNGLEGVMIYDARPENRTPVTILAQSGQLMMTRAGPRIQVQKGVRLSKNERTQVLDRLEFGQYTIDLPDQGPLATRWAEPEERTLTNLLVDAPRDSAARADWNEFRAEIHRRFLSPFLPVCLYMVVASVMILGRFSRAYQNMGPVLAAGASLLVIQGAYLGVFSLAKKGVIGIIMMYGVVLLPILGAAFALGVWSMKRASPR